MSAVEAALGRVVAALGSGEPRPGQRTMAAAVADAIDGRHHLIGQAPTGTGKSFAYMVPAILSGRRVVVATATIALQDQLARKDLPHLRRHLGVDFDWAVLKGRGKYLCLQRAAEVAVELAGGRRRRRRGEADPDELRRLLAWAGRSTTGDRAEADFEPKEAAWAALSVDGRSCPGAARCPSGGRCFAAAARRRAEAADVVVVNLHLLCLDAATGGRILPPADVVVIDECHVLEDVAAAAFGTEVGPGRLLGLAREVAACTTEPRTVERLERAARLLAAAVEPFAGQRVPAGSLEVPSPFDHRRQGLLYVAAHLPPPTDPAWQRAALGELERVVRAAGGRTLALFTSRRAMRAAVEALRPRLPWRVLAQGDAAKDRLLAAFAAEETSCLFATASFWQGVDVPGPAVSAVVIDRIPFPRPDEPLTEAGREAAGAGAFRVVDLPRAATMLAQGAGRLIRTATDRGVVAVLDPRLVTRTYGAALLAKLPPMRRTTSPAAVEAFLRDCVGAEPAADGGAV